MPAPAGERRQVVQVFAPVFTAPTFAHACLPRYGTILAGGRRTVVATWRAVGLAHDPLCWPNSPSPLDPCP